MKMTNIEKIQAKTWYGEVDKRRFVDFLLGVTPEKLPKELDQLAAVQRGGPAPGEDLTALEREVHEHGFAAALKAMRAMVNKLASLKPGLEAYKKAKK